MHNKLSIKKQIELSRRYPKSAISLLYDRLRPGGIRPLEFPRLLVLYITERCNMNCHHCNNAAARNAILSTPRSELPLDTVKKILEEAAPFAPFVYLIGGEPLMHSRITDILSAMKTGTRPLCAAMTTNGFFLERYAESIANNLDFVSVSLDHSTPEEHDLTRGLKGTFRRIRAGVDRLIEIRGTKVLPNIKVNSVIMEDNIDDLDALFRLCLEMGVDEWQLSHFSFKTEEICRLNEAFILDRAGGPVIEGCLIDRSEYLDAPVVEQLERILGNIRKKAGTTSLKVKSHPDIGMSALASYYGGKEPDAKHSRCDIPFNRLYVRGNGDVEMCQGFKLGNIHDTSLTACWLSEKAKRFRSTIRHHGITPACYRCCELDYHFN